MGTVPVTRGGMLATMTVEFMESTVVAQNSIL